MITAFSVENFRCFEQLKIEPLERVNLIGGMNNVGKTALLEAISLHFGINKLYIPLQLNDERGAIEKSVDIERNCNWLFYNQEINREIYLTDFQENQKKRTLKLKLINAKDTEVFTFHPQFFVRGSKKKDLEIEYQKEDGSKLKYRLFVAVDNNQMGRLGWQTEGDGEIDIPLPLVFLKTDRHSFDEDIERYSILKESQQEENILKTLTILEPRLKELSILVSYEKPMLYANLGLEHLVPLPLSGEGMVRLLSIVLAIANAPNGIVLIDEIDNGLHHSVLTTVWQAIGEAARRSNTQIFATTHSIESIRAAHDAFSESEIYDFHYHRLERIGDRIKAITYDRESIETSTELNLEMR
ncbi:MAG: ATP/GTP-binding protein [Spirulina sp.]